MEQEGKDRYTELEKGQSPEKKGRWGNLRSNKIKIWIEINQAKAQNS